MFVAGTRPELIKIAPVVRAIARQEGPVLTIVSTAQQADLLPAFLGLLGVEVDYCLNAMSPGQSLNALLSKTVAALDPVIEVVQPALIVVQGDTTSALAGALAAGMRGVPVAHIEAGLRTGDVGNPFPEESNRRLVSHLASLHFAPTSRNRKQLLSEGIPDSQILVTGNPIVASLQQTLGAPCKCPQVDETLTQLKGLKPIVVTTHRRESLDGAMRRNLIALRDFVTENRDTALILPIHLNPRVRDCVRDVLAGAERVKLIEPLDYPCFLRLLQSAWLVASDSGGVQEEVASLGKALLVLRRVTERPEAVESGIAQLAGEWPGQLESLLSDRPALTRWIGAIGPIPNPFGDAQTPERIAAAITDLVVRQSRLKATDSKSVVQ
jgi:UDP-N-acetylglucosamine 2-epimerase (non-hydrolysing)